MFLDKIKLVIITRWEWIKNISINIVVIRKLITKTEK